MPNAPELTERWIAAWAHMRGLEVTQLGGWPLVHTRSRTRESELICSNPGPQEFAALMRHIDGNPRAMLTVIADDIAPYASLELPAGARVDRDDETLMTTTLVRTRTTHDPTFTSRWDCNGNAVTLRLERGSSVVSEGTIGVHLDVATFDSVETCREFQRRGLGSHVLSRLTSYAINHGAVTGVLAASAQGRALYESLGWDATLQMRSLMGARAPR